MISVSVSVQMQVLAVGRCLFHPSFFGEVEGGEKEPTLLLLKKIHVSSPVVWSKTSSHTSTVCS